MVAIVEPFIGVLVSNTAKRAVGQEWSKAQSIGMVLELVVDYIILIFLVFMATQYSTNSLKISVGQHSATLSKEAWALVFLLVVIFAAVFWKQSKKQVFATINLKSSPKWLHCLGWNLPSLGLAFSVTYFLFEVVAV